VTTRDAEKFVRQYMNGHARNLNRHQLAEELGMPTSTFNDRLVKLRRLGLRLPQLTRRVNPPDVERLQKIVDEMLEQKTSYKKGNRLPPKGVV
jgi:hypothetical protein